MKKHLSYTRLDRRGRKMPIGSGSWALRVEIRPKQDARANMTLGQAADGYWGGGGGGTVRTIGMKVLFLTKVSRYIRA